MLLATLQLDAYWCDQPLPSRAHIARLLKQAGLIRQDLPHTTWPNYLEPNSLLPFSDGKWMQHLIMR
jgi:hypothetical protein